MSADASSLREVVGAGSRHCRCCPGTCGRPCGHACMQQPLQSLHCRQQAAGLAYLLLSVRALVTPALVIAAGGWCVRCVAASWHALPSAAAVTTPALQGEQLAGWQHQCWRWRGCCCCCCCCVTGPRRWDTCCLSRPACTAGRQPAQQLCVVQRTAQVQQQLLGSCPGRRILALQLRLQLQQLVAHGVRGHDHDRLGCAQQP